MLVVCLLSSRVQMTETILLGVSARRVLCCVDRLRWRRSNAIRATQTPAPSARYHAVAASSPGRQAYLHRRRTLKHTLSGRLTHEFS